MGTATVGSSDITKTNFSCGSAPLVSQPNLMNETQLCFNKNSFNRMDFNVVRFVNMARRRAELQQIHSDLRIYLKIIQNSMVELINDDYADFVNLSSNLVGLKETIQKLFSDFETVWHDFRGSTQDMQQLADFVEQKANHLFECRQAQWEIHAQILLIRSIERLTDRIVGRPEEIEPIWLQGFADKVVDTVLWFHKAKKVNKEVTAAYAACLNHVRELTERWLVENLRTDCRFVGQIFGIIVLINGVDSAVSRVMTEVIGEKIRIPTNIQGDFLDELYGTICKLREDWITKLKKNDVSVANISLFLDKCLLTFIISFLDQHFGAVVVPSDCSLFRYCYKTTCNFIKSWPDAANSRTILRMIRDKFSLIVYFKLETQHFFLESKEHFDSSTIKMVANQKNERWEGKIFCYYSKLVVDTLERVWSDEVYLPSLIDKSWDFSLKILSKYLEWIENIKKYHLINKKTSGSVEVRHLLCAVYADCTTIDGRVFGIALSSIWPKIRELGLDVTVFGQCLSLFSTSITAKKKDFENFIAGDVVAMLEKIVDGVAGIPRQYRWTRKPAPIESSPYVTEASTAINRFKDEMQWCCWDEEDVTRLSKHILVELLKMFCSKAEQVLESVEQTETSLQRFKRKSLAVSENNSDSDENKIRRQLLLDMEKFRSWAVSYNIDISHIDMIMLRANPSSESDKFLASVRSVPDMAEVTKEKHDDSNAFS